MAKRYDPIERLLVDPNLYHPNGQRWSEVAEQWTEDNLSANWYTGMAARMTVGMRERNVNLEIQLKSCNDELSRQDEEIERLKKELKDAKEGQKDQEGQASRRRLRPQDSQGCKGLRRPVEVASRIVGPLRMA